jgi:PAS domain S-box-containing protein
MDIQPTKTNTLNKAFAYVRQRLLPSPPAKPSHGLHYWQQQIFLAVILCMVILGLGTYISGSVQFARGENWTMVILNTGFYLFALLTAFSPKINLRIRFYAILSLLFFVGIALTLVTGTAGSGPAWLFSFAILAGIFLSVKGAIFAIGINALSLITIRIIAEYLPGTFSSISEMGPGAYTTVIVNFLLLNGMISISLSVLTNGLSKTLIREKETSCSLEKEIAEHRLTGSRLAYSEQRLKLAMDAVHDGLWDWDLLTDEVFFSPRWQTMLGYEPGEIVGYAKSWMDLVHPKDIEGTSDTLQRHLDNETSYYENEHRLRTKTGDWLWILDRGKVVERDPNGKPVRMTGTHTDISRRKRIEAELENERQTLAHRVAEQTAQLQAANQELMQASKMKDNFLASISHELRTPLNAILGFSEALREGIYGPLTREQSESISHIQDGGNHLVYLINDILDISKLQAEETKLNCESLSIRKIAEDCFTFINQAAISKQIATIRNIDPLVTYFVADERRFKQILINLLSNAIKFTPEGGSIGLDIKGHPEDHLIKFSVWDNGIGISANDIPKLFKPFIQLDSRLSRNHNGTGLGLALVHHLTKLHQGRIEVESEPENGSRFTIILPWTMEENTSGEKPENKTDIKLMHAFQKAMIIEDSNIVADLIVRYLKELGINSEVCSSVNECSPAIIAEKQPDVIILDILLPETSGWYILEQLKENPGTENIPVIVATILNEREKGMTLGASEYLQKPITRSALTQVLRRVADNKILRRTKKSTTEHRENITILLAEDNHSNAETILDYLEINGYTTIWAKNGREAVEKVKLKIPRLILMDMQMPEMDGLEAISQIRQDENFTSTPIIALTALAMPGDKERFLNAGANAYLSKPIGLKNLLQVISNLLE